ncbi:MAG: hypothetical protein HLUCCA13_12990 [Halomonas sp. HL-48]|nr:MAG: hypothetical protein HLUCCA13_12990 [Halomonas sp. HL-48]
MLRMSYVMQFDNRLRSVRFTIASRRENCHKALCYVSRERL